MNFLEERITKDGIVKEGNVLKVDSFLNHQMDIQLFDEIGEEFKRRFANEHINKILTIEASGIGIALSAAPAACPCWSADKCLSECYGWSFSAIPAYHWEWLQDAQNCRFSGIAPPDVSRRRPVHGQPSARFAESRNGSQCRFCAGRRSHQAAALCSAPEGYIAP